MTLRVATTALVDVRRCQLLAVPYAQARARTRTNDEHHVRCGCCSRTTNILATVCGRTTSASSLVVVLVLRIQFERVRSALLFDLTAGCFASASRTELKRSVTENTYGEWANGNYGAA